MATRKPDYVCDFYPRSPCGERHLNLPSRPIDKNISIHALLAESDAVFAVERSPASRFLSTLSLRRATINSRADNVKRDISIHALLAESDQTKQTPKTDQGDFYPRSPCGERLMCTVKLAAPVLFLSTLSLRRATRTGLTCGDGRSISIHALLAESDKDANDSSNTNLNFYPRSPCGERRGNDLGGRV